MQSDCKLCPFNTRATSMLSEESFGQLSDNHLELKFKKGDTIIKQGMFSTNVVFLRRGLAKIHLNGPYHEQIVRLVKAPTYLGLPTTFGDKVNQYSVTAVTETEVCYIDVHIFQKILNENREFSNEIIIELCQNELESFRRCANRTQKQIRGNMADVLIEFAEKIFQADSFTLPVSQSELANLVDTSRESVSRVLSEFDRDGLIRLEGKKIEIVNKKSLRLISQNG
ncbi:MAG: Crp/Fnr family transcriptional regulator [Paludibacter sp.]|nr:Crp/Fnr family transcriptional regulator [Paludibacter sp.]MDD3489922.1 Crp/Fnr family transcriptional regulator [Paludibacter sp.]